MISSAEQISRPLSYEDALPAEAVEVARQYMLGRTGRVHTDNVGSLWAALSDSDCWELLGYLIEQHPQWSDQRCRAILHSWVDVRSRDPWQAKLLVFWARWKQHHKELIEGLNKAAPLAWLDICRFCEIWSANRPIMSPFSGVAKIVLDTVAGGQQQRVGVKPKDVKYSDILVITVDTTITEFSEFGASRQLVWALEHSGLSWSFCQPWDDNIRLKLDSAKSVIFWSYHHRSHDFAYHAVAIERLCNERKIPVINSMLSGWDVRHSTILSRFQQAGIHCPTFQKFTHVDDIELDYPLILRVDGIHRGQQMQWVQSADQAHKLLSLKQKQFLALGGANILPPPNLAIEFIDTADAQGRFHKCRAYVVGSNVVLRHKTISTHWLVNFASAETFQDSVHANRDFIRGGEANLELLVRAGQASGSDITALDYSVDQNGHYVFWEANRLFKMNGDKDYDLAELTSEKKMSKRVGRDQKLGGALLALFQDRLGCLSNEARA